MRCDRLALLGVSSLLAFGLGCSTDGGSIDQPNPMPEPDPDPDPVAGVWSAAQLVHDLPGSSRAPIVRVGGSGSFAMWEQTYSVAPYNRLWTSRRVGVSWEAPTLIANDSNVSSQLYVAGDAANAHVAWKRWINNAWEIVAADAQSGGTWQPTVLRSSTWQQGSLADPRVAARSGQSAIIWAVEDPATRRLTIEGRVRKDTTGWMPIPAAATGVTLATSAGPLYDLAYDDAGRLVVTWVEQQTDRAELWARRGVPADGSLSITWETAQKVATVPAPQNTQVVQQLWSGTHAGRSFAAWMFAATDGTLSIAASHLRPDGLWDAEQSTTNIKSGHYAPPRFVAGADGHKVVVWREPLTDSSRILARTYDPNAGWSDDQIVADGLKAPYLGCIDIDAYYDDVAIDGHGNAIVVWEERLDEQVQGRSLMGIWSSQRLVGSGWQTPVRLDGGGRMATVPTAALVDGSIGAALYNCQGDDGRIMLATNHLAPAETTP